MKLSGNGIDEAEDLFSPSFVDRKKNKKNSLIASLFVIVFPTRIYKS